MVGEIRGETDEARVLVARGVMGPAMAKRVIFSICLMIRFIRSLLSQICRRRRVGGSDKERTTTPVLYPRVIRRSSSSRSVSYRR